MVEDFHVSEMVAISGLMTYLFGLGAGSVVLAPVSEICGRRPVYVGSMFVFMALVLPSALATSMTEILVVRFFWFVILSDQFLARDLVLTKVPLFPHQCLCGSCHAGQCAWDAVRHRDG